MEPFVFVVVVSIFRFLFVNAPQVHMANFFRLRLLAVDGDE